MNAEIAAELIAAHQIIHNAMELLTPRQRHELARRNAHDGVSGSDIARSGEREAVIRRATVTAEVA